MVRYGTLASKVLRIQIRIRRLHMFLGLPDPDPLVSDTGTDQYLDPSIIVF